MQGRLLSSSTPPVRLAEVARGEADLSEAQALLADHFGDYAEGCALPLPESCWQPD